MKDIIEIIGSIENSSVFTNIKPTEIYNEGWMTRLLVYYSKQENIKLKKIDFSKMANWTSEGLLSSPFVGVKNVREGHTHADIALGDFMVNYKKNGVGSGKITVKADADVFGVIEAKMGSSLSALTKNAEEYNQASRTVACIAHNMLNNCETFFYVVLPATKAAKRSRAGITIQDLVNEVIIKEQIQNRYSFHNKKNDVKLDSSEILTKVTKCALGIITYEEWIELFTDENIKSTLNDFYSKCKKWNNIK
jgi:hypothetical protein